MQIAEQRGIALTSLGVVKVRLFNLATEQMLIRDLKSSSIGEVWQCSLPSTTCCSQHQPLLFPGKLVSVKGTVLRASTPRPLVVEMDFLCSQCGSTATTKFEDGKYTLPSKCSGELALLETKAGHDRVLIMC
jgi:MCM OB domain